MITFLETLQFYLYIYIYINFHKLFWYKIYYFIMLFPTLLFHVQDQPLYYLLINHKHIIAYLILLLMILKSICDFIDHTGFFIINHNSVCGNIKSTLIKMIFIHSWCRVLIFDHLYYWIWYMWAYIDLSVRESLLSNNSMVGFLWMENTKKS